MSSDMHFDNPHALPPEKVKSLNGGGYVALSAIILDGGMLWVKLEADVSQEPDAEHTVAIQRDQDTSTITLAANELEDVSKSDEEPADTPYLNVSVNNLTQE
jgi:hypothetical protein